METDAIVTVGLIGNVQSKSRGNLIKTRKLLTAEQVLVLRPCFEFRAKKNVFDSVLVSFRFRLYL